MLLLANLGVARALLSCEPVAGTVSAHAQPAGSDTHGEHAQHGVPDETRDDAPESAQCCQAMASCTATGDFAGTSFARAVAIISMSAETALLEAPVTRLTAPEPPPPRA